MHLLLMLFACAEGFLLWFLAGLIRESRQLASSKGKADRMWRGTTTRREGPILVTHSSTGQEETVEKAFGKRNALMTMGALPFTRPLHGHGRGDRISARMGTS
jgi:hypothetical protein